MTEKKDQKTFTIRLGDRDYQAVYANPKGELLPFVTIPNFFGPRKPASIAVYPQALPASPSDKDLQGLLYTVKHSVHPHLAAVGTHVIVADQDSQLGELRALVSLRSPSVKQAYLAYNHARAEDVRDDAGASNGFIDEILAGRQAARRGQGL
jgi:hypothetical protein